MQICSVLSRSANLKLLDTHDTFFFVAKIIFAFLFKNLTEDVDNSDDSVELSSSLTLSRGRSEYQYIGE